MCETQVRRARVRRLRKRISTALQGDQSGLCKASYRVSLSLNGRFTNTMNEEFVERLKLAFGNATMAEIARRLDVPHATIRNYFLGRLPAPDVLMKIAGETNVSLNWLLLGAGEMYLRGAEPIDLGRIIDRRILEIVDRRLAEVGSEVQQLGAIDQTPPFDVESAIARSDDPQAVIAEWFRYESREVPADYGVVFFDGWSSYTAEEKADAVRDAKRVLDRVLRKK